MGRILRVDVGDIVYHVINRANFRSVLFKNDGQYQGFINVLREGLDFVPMRILAYCLMPNHWHLVLYPQNDGDLSRFMQWVSLTHTQRYHAATNTRGYGHIYQGRYRSLPVESDRHFLIVARYVERNAKRAALVERAEEWKWSSANARLYGDAKQRQILSPWPTAEPHDYVGWLNVSQPKEEVENLRYNIRRSKLYGSEQWTAEMIEKFGLENSARNLGRPRNGTAYTHSNARNGT